MKRLSFIFIFLILFMICAPVFSLAATAPFQFYTMQSAPVSDSTHFYYVLASDDSDGILVSVESQALQNMTNAGLVFNTDGRPSFYGYSSIDGSYQFNLSYYDLKNGYLLSTETKQKTVFSGDYFWYPNQIFELSDYVSFPVYIYAVSPASFPSQYQPASALYTVVDPFVQWGTPDPGSGPGPTPDPVDPTSVIRSLIPRPFGNASTMYIADHLYLYSIYMGIPQQFEEQGLIQTSLDPAKYSGDNYNIYDVSFTGSGSSLNFTIKNRAQFSYNVIVSKYDVVDGSYISSSIYTTIVASSADNPSTITFSLSLSDPSTYGIYQSGFFARSHVVDFPELRISWSDTIDYSLDFFVIRQGLVTIVENQTSIIGGIAAANSTLNTISSTTASILQAINTFYTLCDTNFTWFKTTYYNSILNRWYINKTQLDTIISLIEGNGQTTYPENQSVSDSVDNYVSQEDVYFSNFDSAGSDIDGVFDEAISQFSGNSYGFGFIKMILETFVFSIPSSYIIVFVSLTFGLIVMIIGRVVGGKT